MDNPEKKGSKRGPDSAVETGPSKVAIQENNAMSDAVTNKKSLAVVPVENRKKDTAEKSGGEATKVSTPTSNSSSFQSANSKKPGIGLRSDPAKDRSMATKVGANLGKRTRKAEPANVGHGKANG